MIRKFLKAICIYKYMYIIKELAILINTNRKTKQYKDIPHIALGLSDICYGVL